MPKSMLAGIESGELQRSDAPDPGWGPRPVILTESGEAAAEVLRNEAPEANPRIACEITSIVFDWVFDGPINRISQEDDTITLEYGRDLTRTVHMDDIPPRNITPSRGGFSLGHWEGDTLVVESVNFLEGRLSGAVPHSDQLKVTERFTLQRDWQNRIELLREFVAEDSVYFQDQYTGSDRVLLADAPFAIDQCKELAFEYSQE